MRVNNGVQIEDREPTTNGTLVSIVDDDASVRESLPDLLKLLGYDVRAFASAEDFLSSGRVADTGCLILDIAMPGMSGPDLQRELSRRGREIPIVFITANGDPDECVRVLAAGAASCLIKPFSDTALLGAVTSALRSG